ncbi:MAG: glycosyltransferase family 39 protein [Bacteroidia bacterium]
MFNKKTLSIVVLLTTLVVASGLLYRETITLFPSFIHAWTQSERYAIALCFLENGFDFFHPCTFNLQTINGITPIDFPINEYIVALLMKLLNSSSPVIFRIYTLSVSIIGLVHLYLFAHKLTRSTIKSGTTAIFVFLSPIYIYYQAGFIPSVPALSFVFIALYHYFNYIETNNSKQLYTGVLFFLLAALVRMPFFIFLFAALLHSLWNAYNQKKIIIRETGTFLSAICFFGAYYLYNKHLGKLYGNAFLDTFMPARNWEEIKEIIIHTLHFWLFHYFTKAQYLLFFIAVFFTGYYFIKNKNSLFVQKQYWMYFFIAFAGSSLYAILMMRQFYDHDYYFLDSLFTPTILLFTLCLSHLPFTTKKHQIVWTVLIVLLSTKGFLSAKHIQTERYTQHEWDRVEISRQNFEGADLFLDSIGVSKEAKLLVIDAYSTNIPLILMKRKGYTVYQTNRDDAMMPLLNYKWDYVVIQDVFLLSDVLHYYPLVNHYIEKVAGNGKISLYKRSAIVKEKSLKQFLNINNETALLSTFNAFDNAQKQTPFSETLIDSIFYSQPQAAIVKKDAEYQTLFEIKGAELKNKQYLNVLVSAQLLSRPSKSRF